MRTLFGIVLLACALDAQTPVYDLLLKGGHVIDGKNNISAIRDVAIAGRKIAAVAAHIDPAPGLKTVDASGLYIVPGLVDIHAHVYTYNGRRGAFADDHGIMPDGFTFRAGVTTVVDQGSSGWRTFDDFKTRIIDHSRTPVLALLNIAGYGMRGGKYEQDLGDMAAKPSRNGSQAQGPGCRRQERPLQWTGVETLRTGRGSRQDGEHTGDDRLRRQFE
jgi:dihydroorotase